MNKRLIDGDKLLEWAATRVSVLEEAVKSHTGYHLRHLTGQHSALIDLEWEIQEGRFDLSSDQGEAARLREALVKAERFISNVMSFCGEGIEVVNWHQNGDTEPLDNIFESNMDGDELDVIRKALSSHKEDSVSHMGLVPESEIEVYRIEDVRDGHPLSDDTGIQKVQGIEWIPFVPQVAREKIEENDYLIFYNDRICQATHDAMSGFFYRETAAGMVIYPYRSISHYAEFNVPGITDGGGKDFPFEGDDGPYADKYGTPGYPPRVPKVRERKL